MVAVSFIQGLCLLLLYRALEADLWPAQEPIWLTTLLAFLIAVPAFILFTVERENYRRLLICLGPYALLLVLIAAYTGLQMEPVEIVNVEALPAVFTLTIGIASFKALMYTQEYLKNKSISYGSLLSNSWHNFLVMGFSLLFLLLFLGILFLWGAIFDLIGIGLFSYLFRQDWFLIPAGSVAFGIAVITFRNLVNIVESVSRLLKTLLKFLLPILAVISVLFLAFLPFTGLETLWDTDYGSGLLLWLQALILFAVNAVYQTEKDELPYPLDMHRFIYVAIALLPIYSILIFYGMSLRIAQYGLTVPRCWALIIAGLMALFAIGYLISIIKKRDTWLHGLAWVNIRMGLFVMILMVLVNTPLLNLQGISAQSQLNRHLSGNISFAELDLNYLRWSLGRQGYLALEELKTLYQESDPELVANIDFVLESNRFTPLPQSVAEIENRLVTWPDSRELPEVILVSMQSGRRWERLYALFVDLNNDGTEEILTFFKQDGFEQMINGNIWVSEPVGWQAYPYSRSGVLSTEILDELLIQGAISQQANQWNDLILGGAIIRINLNENALLPL
tara:strand:- start:1192 stop:2883 length:1692 start_codon:yes stop_codon:yes gene_type:complete